VLNMGQSAAQGVNLLVFVPAGIAALIVHRRAGRLDKKRGLTLFVSGALGAVGGALLATMFDPLWLKRAYGAFLIVLSVIQFFSWKK